VCLLLFCLLLFPFCWKDIQIRDTISSRDLDSFCVFIGSVIILYCAAVSAWGYLLPLEKWLLRGIRIIFSVENRAKNILHILQMACSRITCYCYSCSSLLESSFLCLFFWNMNFTFTLFSSSDLANIGLCSGSKAMSNAEWITAGLV